MAKKPIGLAPGTPIYVGGKAAKKTKVTIIDYNQRKIDIKTVTSAKECAAFKQKKTISWINVCGLHDVNMIEQIGKLYDLHPLIIEDVLNTQQRPKLDIFSDYLFLTMKLYFYNKKLKKLIPEQISLILGKNFVITFQEKPSDIFNSIYTRLNNPQSRIRSLGADYLSHALIDIVVDSYFPILEGVGDKIEDIEEALVVNSSPKTLQEIHALKREMILLRKSVWPLREIISGLQRRITTLITDDTILYLKDIYDHTIQVIDTVETNRDLLSGMIDLYISNISNRMNEVMKVLTVFASIFIPLTFVTGLYGMNFNPRISPFNMPELDWRYGYFFALGIMALIVIVMLAYFKRRKWW